MKKIFFIFCKLIFTNIMFNALLATDVQDNINLFLNDELTNIILFLKNKSFGQIEYKNFKELCSYIAEGKEISYDLTLNGLIETINLLEKNKTKFDSDFYNGFLSLLQSYIENFATRKINFQNDKIDQMPCFIAGSFNTSGSNGSIISKIGCNYTVQKLFVK